MKPDPGPCKAQGFAESGVRWDKSIKLWETNLLIITSILFLLHIIDLAGCI